MLPRGSYIRLPWRSLFPSPLTGNFPLFPSPLTGEGQGEGESPRKISLLKNLPLPLTPSLQGREKKMRETHLSPLPRRETSLSSPLPRRERVRVRVTFPPNIFSLKNLPPPSNSLPRRGGRKKKGDSLGGEGEKRREKEILKMMA